METQHTIFNRRSIRKYTGGSIDSNQIEEIIRAGMYAPSARNMQSWHFVVCSNREKLLELSEIHPYGKMLKEASHAILVCGDLSIEPSVEYNLINCSAAIQNMLLMTHDLGFGAVWLGVFPREERVKAMTDFFGLPENIIPVGLVSLGIAAETPAFPNRIKPERIHWETF